MPARTHTHTLTLLSVIHAANAGCWAEVWITQTTRAETRRDGLPWDNWIICNGASLKIDSLLESQTKVINQWTRSKRFWHNPSHCWPSLTDLLLSMLFLPLLHFLRRAAREVEHPAVGGFVEKSICAFWLAKSHWPLELSGKTQVHQSALLKSPSTRHPTVSRAPVVKLTICDVEGDSEQIENI